MRWGKFKELNVPVKFALALGLVVTGFLPGAANASVLYDNLSAATGVFTVNFISSPPQGAGPIYDSFSTLGSPFSFMHLQLVVGLDNRAPVGSFDVALYHDSGSNTPGSLAQDIATVLDSALSPTLGVVSISVPAITLAANTRYWIGLNSQNTNAGWYWSNDISGPGVANEFECIFDGCAPNIAGPFLMQVSGVEEATPLPATLPLFASGIGGLSLLGWRRKKRGSARAA